MTVVLSMVKTILQEIVKEENPRQRDAFNNFG